MESCSFKYYHAEVGIGGVELHVDLLVQEGLGFGVEILSDDGHLDGLELLDCTDENKRWLLDAGLCSITHWLCEQNLLRCTITW